jgi:hypothetical protein
MNSSEQNEINLRQIKKILNAGGATAAIPKPPNPLKRFNLPKNLQTFFDYFDSHDIRTPENFLF